MSDDDYDDDSSLSPMVLRGGVLLVSGNANWKSRLQWPAEQKKKKTTMTTTKKKTMWGWGSQEKQKQPHNFYPSEDQGGSHLHVPNAEPPAGSETVVARRALQEEPLSTERRRCCCCCCYCCCYFHLMVQQFPPLRYRHPAARLDSQRSPAEFQRYLLSTATTHPPFLPASLMMLTLKTRVPLLQRTRGVGFQYCCRCRCC